MTPDLRIQPGPHVFVADLDAPVLDEDDRHHLGRALRLRSGDPLTLSDGAGRWCPGRFGDEVTATGPVIDVPPPRYEVGVAVALTKAAKPEFAVQKATEVGVDRIVLFGAARSVVRWDAAKQAKNLTRLRRVAREAAMQSHRVTVPAVEIVADIETLASVSGVARADFGGGPVTPDHRMLLIGPEGGWSVPERAVVPTTVDLGPTVLRAETAAVVASSLLVMSRDRSD